MTAKDKRIFGLDLLRSIAIIIVVQMHSRELFPFRLSGIPSFSMIDGVDLFFVLSGFLVGSMIINSIDKKKQFKFFDMLNFLQRRWFRTLPNYFLFLLINIVLIYFGLVKGELNKYLVTYFVFFQNFYKPYDFLFWESWSLSVEEWFYLLFPIILFLLLTFTRKYKTVIISTILLFLLFPLAYRIIHSNMSVDGDFWDLYFRKLVLTRLDCIGYGILGAYIHKYHEIFWNKYKKYFFIAGLLIMLFLCINTIEYNMFYFKTFFFSLFGLSILLLIPKLESIKTEKIPLRPFAFISKISYSMYLCHIPLYQLIINNSQPTNKWEMLLVFLFYWVSVILFSTLVYKLFEKPMMNLREIFSRKKIFLNN